MAEKNTDSSDGKKPKDNIEELKKQLAQLNREWETLQTAIPAQKAAEAIMAYLASKPKDPFMEGGPDWSNGTTGGEVCAAWCHC